MEKVVLRFLFLFLFVKEGFSQTLPTPLPVPANLQYLYENYSVMLPEKTYSDEEGKKYNDSNALSHPDFGKLPYNSPYGIDLVEVLSKRKVDERYYVDKNEPTIFYLQKSATPMNFYKDGFLRAIDPTLHKYSHTNAYHASDQIYPTKLDFGLQQSALYCSGYFVENNRYSLAIIDNSNTVTTYTANWSNYVVGNNGAIITNVFPGIDLKLAFGEGKVKSSFIINSAIPNVKKLIFTDHLNLSPGLTLTQQSGFPGQLFVDDINVNDAESTTQFLIKKAISFDHSGNTSHFTFNNYKVLGNDIELHVDSNFLNMPGLVYPLEVDPIFTAVGPVAGAALIGSLNFPGFCTDVLVVAFSGGSTPWDFSASWLTTQSNCCSLAGFCTNAFPFIDIRSSCGGKTPTLASWWSCSGACGTPGTWGPTIPFGSSGCQSMVQCYPPSCASQNFTFTLEYTRGATACPNTGGCNCTFATSTCSRLNSWNVTLQGRSAETITNTVTGNGTNSTAAVCFSSVTLNPTPAYGVGPYTYNWSPGGSTSPTIAFTPTNTGSSVFTCTVTDLCGTVRVATLTVTNNCVLPVELSAFDGMYDGNNAVINWKTTTEHNTDYFLLEKSYDGEHYELVEKVKAAGNSSYIRSYTVYDPNPNRKGVTYYRLKLFDLGSNSPKFDKTLAININETSGELLVIPNPASTNVSLVMPEKLFGKNVSVDIFDNVGRKNISVTADISNTANALNLSINDLNPGVYFIRVTDNAGTVLKKTLVKE